MKSGNKKSRRTDASIHPNEISMQIIRKYHEKVKECKVYRGFKRATHGSPLRGIRIFIMSIMVLFLLPYTVHASEISNQFTVSVWVKGLNSVATKAIVAKAEEIRVVTNASGNPMCQIKTTTWQTAVTSSTAIVADTWAYVTCTYDKVTLRVFVNGVQTGTQALTVAVDDTANVFKIGEDDSSGSTYADFAGVVDDFQVYNYARVGGQIMEDYNAGHPAIGTPVGSPVLHLSFDEGYGDTAYDKSPQGNDGDLAGTCPGASTCPTWTNNGKYGKALSFDGGDYVDTNQSLAQTDFTISSWFKLTDVSTYHIIVSKESPGGQPWNYRLMIAPTSGFLFGDIADGVNSAQVITTTSVADGSWHQGIFTRDTTSDKIYLYVDGELISSTTDPTTGGEQNAQEVWIGRSAYTGGGGYYFNGSIDEVKIYNFALTEDEVKADYNQGKSLVVGAIGTESDGTTPSFSADRAYCVPGDTSTCNPPVAEWNFDEGSGQYAQDTSGNGNTGTLGSSSGSDSADPSWTQGRVGKALSFDGGDDYMDVSNAAGLNSSYSLSAWAKATSFSANSDQDIIAIPRTAGDLHGVLMEVGCVSGVCKLRYLHRMPIGSSGGDDLSGITRVYPGNWYNIVLTRDSATKAMKIYINGVLDNSMTGTSADFGSTALRMYIGKLFITSSVRMWPGLIDQVRIYNYARTPAQIAWDYNKGAPVAWYKFDECQGTTINDWAPGADTNSFAGNTGTLNIGATGTQTSAGTCESGTGTEAWSNGTTGKFNASINLDGEDDVVSVGNLATSIHSVSVWVKPSSTSQSVIDLDGGTHYISVSSGTVSATGFASPTIYVDGKVLSTLPDTGWHVITVTTATGFTASNVSVGKVGANYFSGQIDDVRIYNYPLTSVQVRDVYNNGAVNFR